MNILGETEMAFTKQEIKQHIRNIKHALVLVDSIPKRNWVPQLHTWAEFCEDPKEVRKMPDDREPDAECTTASEEQLIAHTCGSAACFGGWVAVDPYFKAQGVRRDPQDGSPEFHDEVGTVTAYPRDVAEKLFGHREMFSGVGFYFGEGERQDVSERKLVKRRLKIALKQAQERLGALVQDGDGAGDA